jgi:hypothetical protein
LPKIRLERRIDPKNQISLKDRYIENITVCPDGVSLLSRLIDKYFTDFRNMPVIGSATTTEDVQVLKAIHEVQVPRAQFFQISFIQLSCLI